jgi:hypothetical protein
MGGFLGNLGGAAQSLGGMLGQQTGLMPAVSGLQQVGTGLQSLFGGGPPAAPPGELVGPPSPFQAPSFLEGISQGFTGALQNLGDQPQAGGQLGQGLGQLLSFIDERRRAQGEGGLGQIIDLAGPLVPGMPSPFMPRRVPAPPLPNVTPESTLVGRLVSAYTGGILRGG